MFLVLLSYPDNSVNQYMIGQVTESQCEIVKLNEYLDFVLSIHVL